MTCARTSNPLKLFSTHTSPLAIPPLAKKALLKAKPFATCVITPFGNFARDTANFKNRLTDRGYPATLVDPILEEVKFEERSRALTRSTRTQHTRTPIVVTTYDPRVPPLQRIIMKHWHLIRDHDRLSRIFPVEPIVAHRREISLRDQLVRAKTSHQTRHTFTTQMSDCPHSCEFPYSAQYWFLLARP